MFMKRATKQVVSSPSKVKIEGDIISHGVKPTCARWWKKHIGKCLAGTAC